MKYPTTEYEGAMSNALSDIHRRVAARLEKFDGLPLGTARRAEHDQLLAIYVQISIREVNRFYGKVVSNQTVALDTSSEAA